MPGSARTRPEAGAAHLGSFRTAIPGLSPFPCGGVPSVPGREDLTIHTIPMPSANQTPCPGLPQKCPLTVPNCSAYHSKEPHAPAAGIADKWHTVKHPTTCAAQLRSIPSQISFITLKATITRFHFTSFFMPTYLDLTYFVDTLFAGLSKIPINLKFQSKRNQGETNNSGSMRIIVDKVYLTISLKKSNSLNSNTLFLEKYKK
ncbi:MAG: hypothetical protein ACXWAT_08880 [Methylobacter sp.]